MNALLVRAVVVVTSRQDDLLLRAVMAVETALGDACPSGDVLDGRIAKSSLGENLKSTSRQTVWHFRGDSRHDVETIVVR
jgi:hypothetical protein